MVYTCSQEINAHQMLTYKIADDISSTLHNLYLLT